MCTDSLPRNTRCGKKNRCTYRIRHQTQYSMPSSSRRWSTEERVEERVRPAIINRKYTSTHNNKDHSPGSQCSNESYPDNCRSSCNDIRITLQFTYWNNLRTSPEQIVRIKIIHVSSIRKCPLILVVATKDVTGRVKHDVDRADW